MFINSKLIDKYQRSARARARAFRLTKKSLEDVKSIFWVNLNHDERLGIIDRVNLYQYFVGLLDKQL